MWSYAYAVSYIHPLANKKRKHVRTYKLGEIRQIRDGKCDAIGTLEASCRSRIKLCFAILSYPMLSYPIILANTPVPVTYASLCCYNLEPRAKRDGTVYQMLQTLQLFQQTSRSSSADNPSNCCMQKTLCIEIARQPCCVQQSPHSFVHSAFLPSLPPSLPVGKMHIPQSNALHCHA